MATPNSEGSSMPYLEATSPPVTNSRQYNYTHKDFHQLLSNTHGRCRVGIQDRQIPGLSNYQKQTIPRKPQKPAVDILSQPHGVMNNQEQSTLFSLPMEVLEDIFALVLNISPRMNLSLENNFGRVAPEDRKKKSLPLTCRRAYVLSSTLRYSHPTIICSGYDLLRLPCLISSVNLQSIRKLVIGYDAWTAQPPMPFFSPPTIPLTKFDQYGLFWIALWTTLADLHGLRKLSVEIDVETQVWDEWRAVQRELWEDLRDSWNWNEMRDFLLYVDWTDDDIVVDNMPCKILKRNMGQGRIFSERQWAKTGPRPPGQT